MTADILQFGDLALRHKRQDVLSGTGCPHLKLLLDDKGDVVTCEDCKLQVSAYWALRKFVMHFHSEKQKLESARKTLHEQTEASLHLIAARRLEQAWRRRRTLPACPHCYRGLLMTDHFHSVERGMELRRRETEKNKETS